ncbi:MAG: hypothetical protein ACEQSU_14000 [Microgenomates group bacterium]
MTINSRDKGANFEREIARELELLTGIQFRRNLEQARAVDHCDLITDDPAWPISCELKRYAAGTGCKPAWREQATRAAAKTGKVPAVIWKYNRQPIRCTVPFTALGFGRDDEWFECSLPGLAYLAREWMAGGFDAV